MKTYLLSFIVTMLLALAAYGSCTESTTYDPRVQKSFVSTVDFSSAEQQESEGLLLTIKLNEDVLRDKGKVLLDITYKNMIEIPIKYLYATYINQYQIELIDAQGEKLKPRRVICPVTSFRLIGIKPGQEKKHILTLSSLYDLTKPGEYSVRLARPVNRLDDAGDAWVYTNKITFELTQDEIDKYAKSKIVK